MGGLPGRLAEAGDICVGLEISSHDPMHSITSKPKTVIDYIKAAAPEAQKKLREMRACIRTTAPGANEELKWGMPAFSYRRILVIYGAFKNHIGFYPTSSAVRVFAKELTKFKTARGSIQFPLKQPLPRALIRKITVFRVKESKHVDRKWKS